MNFKESKAIYLQIADRICDEVLLGQISGGRTYSFGTGICGCGRGQRQYGDAFVRLLADARSDLQQAGYRLFCVGRCT